MGIFFYISIIGFIIISLDIISIACEVATGTKIKGKCVGFVPFSDANEETPLFGSIFEYEDSGKRKQTFTMNQLEYIKDKTYKILVNNENETRCSVMRDLNKSYVFDLFLFTLTTGYIFMKIHF